MRKAVLGSLLLTLLVPAAASADAARALPTAKRTLVAPAKSTSDCYVRAARSSRAADTASWRAPMSGYVTVRMRSGRRSNWNLAVFDRASGRYLGSSSAFRSREVVQTWVESGQRLVVQGCHRSGKARRARVGIQLLDIAPPKVEGVPQLVRVEVPSRSRFEQLEGLGVDVTHNVHDGHADVILQSAAQQEVLRRHKFAFDVQIADLTAHWLKSRAADRRFTQRVGKSAIPSGRTTYRTYEGIQDELQTIVDEHDEIVKPVTIGTSFQGRDLNGVEIAKNADAPDDGRPVYFVVATHHAREWPSTEAAMEFAWLLVKGYGTDPRITDLLEKSRVVVVPLINPDGYFSTRGAVDPVDEVTNQGDGNPVGQGINPNLDDVDDDGGADPYDCLQGIVTGTCDTRISLAEAIAPPGGVFAYRRKNCNGEAPDPRVPCELQWGVDPNRNYGMFWGGPGSSSDPTKQTYRGTGPWSESETQAVHEFSQRRQVTMIITLHNVAALVLRPPGLASQGFAPDEARMKAIGDAMADEAGYTSQYGFQLYDTTGTTEDWNYAQQGAFGYTIEIGPKDGEFHMPYETGFIDQWTGAYAGEGKGGLQEALLIAAESAADPNDHSVIEGTAPAGRTLRLKKEFTTPTSDVCDAAIEPPVYFTGGIGQTILPQSRCVVPRGVEEVEDGLETTMQVPADGTFEWHVNPSTRPFEKKGEVVLGEIDTEPSQAESHSGDGTEMRNGHILGPDDDSIQDELDPRPEYRDFDVTVPEASQRLRVFLDIQQPDDDYDLYLYRREANGSLSDVSDSATEAGLDEEVIVERDALPAGQYVVRVANYIADGPWTLTIEQFEGQPDQVVPGSEAWTLTCEDGDGTVIETQEVYVDRGQRASLNLACGGTTGGGEQCFTGGKNPKPRKCPPRRP
jgi:hypothetical protein